MTLVQLRHLISLAHTGSFSKSAQALHLTQPALSRSVRAPVARSTSVAGKKHRLSGRRVV